MKVDFGILGKLTRLVMFLLFIAGVLAVAVWYLPVIQQNERMRQKVLKLDAEIQREAEISKNLRASLDAFKRDPKAAERLIRERLGYARPGETIIRFETKDPARAW